MNLDVLRASGGRRGFEHRDERLEVGVLAHVLLDNAALDEVVDILESGDFTSLPARLVWEAMVRMRAAGDPVDDLSLRAELKAQNELRRVGEEFLATLQSWVPTADSVEHYARRIRQLASLRAVLEAARKIQQLGGQPVEDSSAFLAEAEALIASAARARAEVRGPVAMKDAVADTVERLLASAEIVAGGGVVEDAIPTRFAELDRKLGGGFRPGELHIIAGRPGMGKTAIALDLALSLGRGPGIVYELEMSRDELVRRSLTSEGRIDGTRMRLLEMSEADWTRLKNAALELREREVFIDDTPAATLSHVRATARRQLARGGLAWILIDYLQLMRSDERGVGREEQIGGISRGLKGLAKELGIPIIALAQLNRAVETRSVKDRRPQLSDLRDSGSIEQDADTVLFLFREEMYVRDDPELRGVAELIIGKQRAGATGTVRLRYFHEYTRFEALAAEPTEDFRDDFDDSAGGW